MQYANLTNEKMIYDFFSKESVDNDHLFSMTDSLICFFSGALVECRFSSFL